MESGTTRQTSATLVPCKAGETITIFPISDLRTYHQVVLDAVGFEPTKVELVWLGESFDSRRLQGYTALCILRYIILMDSKQPITTIFKERHNTL